MPPCVSIENMIAALFVVCALFGIAFADKVEKDVFVLLFFYSLLLQVQIIQDYNGKYRFAILNGEGEAVRHFCDLFFCFLLLLFLLLVVEQYVFSITFHRFFATFFSSHFSRFFLQLLTTTTSFASQDECVTSVTFSFFAVFCFFSFVARLRPLCNAAARPTALCPLPRLSLTRTTLRPRFTCWNWPTPLAPWFAKGCFPAKCFFFALKKPKQLQFGEHHHCGWHQDRW